MAAYHSFKKLCKQVGLDPACYALHSPRVGATTDAHMQGVPGNVIDFRGRWKSKSSKKRYCRPTIEDLLKLNKNAKL
jgi:hypothetical protein